MLLAGPWWKRRDIVDLLACGQVLSALVCALVWHPDGGSGFADMGVAFIFWLFVLFVPCLLFGSIVIVLVETFREIFRSL